MRMLRITGRVLALSVQREVAHRANLAVSIILMLIDLAASLATLGLIFTQAGTLGGWGPWETLALLGAFQLVSGLLNAFLEPTLAWFAEKVTSGRLDDLLLQPVDSLLMASLGSCAPLSLPRAVLGALLMAAAALRGGTLTAGGVLACLMLLAAGAVITWATRVLLATLAFWAPGFEPSVLHSALWQLGRYPVSIYHSAVQVLLTYVVPMAFIATFPAAALMRGAGVLPQVGVGAAAALSAGAAVLAWRAGVRRYTGATS